MIGRRKNSGTNVAIFKRPNQRRLVDDLPPRRVDDDRARLQRPDHLLSDEAHRLRAQRHMDAEYVCLREHRVDVREVLAERRRVGIPAPRVVDHAHWECMDELGEAPADATQPEDRERLPREVVRARADARGLPLELAHGSLRVRVLPHRREEQVQRRRRRSVIYSPRGVR